MDSVHGVSAVLLTSFRSFERCLDYFHAAAQFACMKDLGCTAALITISHHL